MSNRHKIDRLFSKKIKDRLQVYLTILEIFALILLIMNQYLA